jgi:hypothetical protein
MGNFLILPLNANSPISALLEFKLLQRKKRTFRVHVAQKLDGRLSQIDALPPQTGYSKSMARGIRHNKKFPTFSKRYTPEND